MSTEPPQNSNQFKKAFKIGQYINIAGIRVFARALFRNRCLFVPQLRVKTINQVNFKLLKENGGIKYLVFDKDNTLTIPYERQIHPSITNKFNSLIDLYGKENIAILSNSVGSKEDKGYKEASIIEEALGVKVIRHVNKKPEVNEDVLMHFGTKEPSSIAMIGDRILSDCVMGNTHGYFTIYCEPFDTSPENFMVKLMRKVERNIIPLIAPSVPVEHVVIDKLKDNNKSILDLINQDHSSI